MASPESDAALAAAACVVLCAIRRKRRFWVRPSLSARERYSGSDLLEDLRQDDANIHIGHELRSDGSFKNFCRMRSEDFEILLTMIGHNIAKKDTSFRDAIPVQERLAVTLRFLATGDSYRSLSYLFKISPASISHIVVEVCEAIITCLQNNIKMATCKAEWLAVAKEWNDKWQFPHCLGSMDGKHVTLQAPIGSGSEYYNYKGTFSIIFFAVVNANYNFTYVNVGCQGRLSDGGVFAKTELANRIEQKLLDVPESKILPGRQPANIPVPFMFIADDAFPLKPNIMKRFPGNFDKGSRERIYNGRHSRGRRVVENAFGILSVVFRVIRKPLLLESQKAEKVVLACAHLHNFLRRNPSTASKYSPVGTFDSEDQITGDIIPGEWRILGLPSGTLLKLKRIPRKPCDVARLVRDELSYFFLTDQGKVQWQDNY